MTRIIAGQARGRRIDVPRAGTRPTSDRVRESLFSTLASELIASGATWSDIVVLDLYSGSGALGLEALSRGASAAYLVESGREALRVLRHNCSTVGLEGAEVVGRRVEHLTGAPAPCPAPSLVLADPPYDVRASDLSRALSGLAEAGWIGSGARVVVERSTRDDGVPMPDTWVTGSRRTFGDTSLWYGRADGASTVASTSDATGSPKGEQEEAH
jgi:16S rRNA (guanine966-N2)-methyltransferase